MVHVKVFPPSPRAKIAFFRVFKYWLDAIRASEALQIYRFPFFTPTKVVMVNPHNFDIRSEPSSHATRHDIFIISSGYLAVIDWLRTSGLSEIIFLWGFTALTWITLQNEKFLSREKASSWKSFSSLFLALSGRLEWKIQLVGFASIIDFDVSLLFNSIYSSSLLTSNISQCQSSMPL